MRALSKRLLKLGCARIVLEATGGYEPLVVAALHAAGLPVALVNPRWVRSFANGLGQLAKPVLRVCDFIRKPGKIGENS